jgi:hypothetical protein
MGRRRAAGVAAGGGRLRVTRPGRAGRGQPRSAGGRSR